MRLSPPCVLSLAGFDPGGGAGLLADIKTFEASGVQGLGVCTALTFQTHERFSGMRWVGRGEVLAQLRPLLTAYSLRAVKIGIIDFSTLLPVLRTLRRADPKLPVVWDPILRASAGRRVQAPPSWQALLEMAAQVTLLTPNRGELLALAGKRSVEAALHALGQKAAVLVKSWRCTRSAVVDLLVAGGKAREFSARPLAGRGKHGSGCALSAALAAALAHGQSLEEACVRARAYTRAYLQSGSGRIGFHARAGQHAR